MILIISAKSADYSSMPDERFGRAGWLIKVNTENGEWQGFPNSAASQAGGAGVTAAQFAIDHKADVVVSGDFGPNASRALKAAKVEMRLLTSETTTIEKTVELYKQGKLPVFDS